MRFEVEVLLSSHLARALNDVVTLTRRKTLVHITTVYSVSPPLHPHQHIASIPAAAFCHMHARVC